MADNSQQPVLELVIQPQTGRFDPDDERWQEQVSDFYVGLRAEVGAVRREWSPIAGTKGGVEIVILTLGSAGVFTAAVEYFRAWLRRDRTRSLQIIHTAGDREEIFTIRGEAIDNAVLQTLAAAIGTSLTRPDG